MCEVLPLDVYLLHPGPSCPMWFVRIEKIFHRILYVRRHLFEPCMVEQALRGVFYKRNVIHIILDNAIVQTEKNAQAGLGENCVCRLESDVIAGDIPT